MQVDPGNIEVLQQHAMCAALELPLLPDADDGELFGAALARAAAALQLRGLVNRHPHYPQLNALHYTGPKVGYTPCFCPPADAVSQSVGLSVSQPAVGQSLSPWG